MLRFGLALSHVNHQTKPVPASSVITPPQKPAEISRENPPKTLVVGGERGKVDDSTPPPNCIEGRKVSSMGEEDSNGGDGGSSRLSFEEDLEEKVLVIDQTENEV